MNHEKNEELFDTAFHDAASKHTVVPKPSKSWNRMKVTIDKKKRHRRLSSHLTKVGIAAAAILFGAVVFSAPAQTKAFFPFFTNIKNLSNDFVSFVLGSKDTENNTKPKTTAPPEAGNESQQQNGQMVVETRETISLDQASDRVTFHMPTISFVANSFSIKNAIIYTASKTAKSDQLTLNYSTKNAKTYKIVFNKINKDSMLTSNSNQVSGDVKEIRLNTGPGYLTIEKDNRSYLTFMFSDAAVVIIGDLTEEEIVLIANSFK